jgi:hypothetical protein
LLSDTAASAATAGCNCRYYNYKNVEEIIQRFADAWVRRLEFFLGLGPSSSDLHQHYSLHLGNSGSRDAGVSFYVGMEFVIVVVAVVLQYLFTVLLSLRTRIRTSVVCTAEAKLFNT